MRIHILGICGKFMAGLALLAKQLGHEVDGSDEHAYPPMSEQLLAQGIVVKEGYLPEHVDDADLIIIGNAMRRGYPIVEYVLNKGLKYISGPQWLAEQVLTDRWVLAVAGTHGKTTTTGMLTWMLQEAGLQPGFLIGGVAANFPSSVALGEQPFFVIEADEYDSAFFDKRSKFIHYHPRTLIINNIEFDHGDIFTDLADVQKQFHHLIRTVPGDGLIIHNAEDDNLAATLALGCWSNLASFSLRHGDWIAEDIAADGSSFTVCYQQKTRVKVTWQLMGLHNINNALAAIAAAHHVGVPLDIAVAALATFKGMKQRMEVCGVVNGVTIYDDFAHHPTAIKTTIAGLRHKVGKQRIIVILELGSYTMRQGMHGEQLFAALADADQVIFLKPEDSELTLTAERKSHMQVLNNVEAIVQQARQQAQPGDNIIVMSNRDFAGIQQRLLSSLGK